MTKTSMSTEDKSKAIEKANSYRQMMEFWAWKDFELFLQEQRRTALEMAVNSDELKDIQVQRGIVKCLNAIENHLGYILSAT